jgi:hypothetical protein
VLLTRRSQRVLLGEALVPASVGLGAQHRGRPGEDRGDARAVPSLRAAAVDDQADRHPAAPVPGIEPVEQQRPRLQAGAALREVLLGDLALDELDRILGGGLDRLADAELIPVDYPSCYEMLNFA